MSNPIPLYRDANVTVWTDFDGNGSTVFVEHQDSSLGMKAMIELGLTSEWGERIRDYSAGLYASKDDPEFILAFDALNRTLEALSKREDARCCNRDYNRDGNCDIHTSPGVLRKSSKQGGIA